MHCLYVLLFTAVPTQGKNMYYGLKMLKTATSGVKTKTFALLCIVVGLAILFLLYQKASSTLTSDSHLSPLDDNAITYLADEQS